MATLLPYISLVFIALFGAMLPGADFAIVTKNALIHSRRAGVITALGVGSAIIVHMTYCVLGLAVVIASSHILFNLIKYVGAAYLIYLGVQALIAQAPTLHFSKIKKQSMISDFIAYKQGLLCNLLNPKVIIFFLSIFTVFIKPSTPLYTQIIFACILVFVPTTWFVLLSFVLSQKMIQRWLNNSEKYIALFLGVMLITLGIVLVFLK